MNPPTSAAPILHMEMIEKSFPGVKALTRAGIEIGTHEIHGLVGENGAGKSTLIKIATGAIRADGGSTRINGTVAAIYQELNLIPSLSVRENLFLRSTRSRAGLIDVSHERRAAREVFESLGVKIDPESRAGGLSTARQQLVEIARALLENTNFLIMDEPTASLGPHEVERLFNILRDLRRRGHGILFVSHRLREVLGIADRVTVMRDGATVGTFSSNELTEERLISLMVGRPLARSRAHRSTPPGGELLTVKNLSGGRVRGISFGLRRGEIAGLFGLVGAGRTELARMIFGAERIESGAVHLDGRAVSIRSPRDAIKSGICLLTEDRKSQGLILGLSARENFALPNLGHWSSGGWIRASAETASFLRYVASLRIRLSGPEQPAGHLSGGNQQKLLVARWIENDARVILFDEPTRGIDVAAKTEMYNLIRDLAEKGKAILLISSELPEVLLLCDRILVMRDGILAGEIRDVANATEDQILRLAVR